MTTDRAGRLRPLDYEHFLMGMGLLTANYPPRAGSADSADALLTAWWSVLSDKPWITNAVFEAAVRLTLEHVTDYLPSVGAFARLCRDAREDMARGAQHAAALPPPAWTRTLCPPEEWAAAFARGRRRQHESGNY